MRLLFPQHWEDYNLIDSGDFEKLEKFGRYVLRRPEPQAVWPKNLPLSEWERADATFFLNKAIGKQADQGERGEWRLKKGMPEQWIISYNYKSMHLKFRLGLTSFKHVGLFPEQSENWDYIFDSLSGNKEQSRVLNLFAYTGGASLAAKAAGADVVHLDSVKQVLTWGNENMKESNLDGIRWILDDAFKYVKREVKREKKYHGIILDPPAYGRGPEGEKWILEQHINELIKLCSELLLPQNSFFVLNLYSMGLSSLIAENIVNRYFDNPSHIESGEIYIPDSSHRKLPLGTYLRFRR
jgi:23S rRNA (cytosine1962-C5)-methyltransferase